MKPILFLFCVLMLAACSSNDEDVGPVDYEPVVLPCLLKQDAEYIIRSNEEYIEMATEAYREMMGGECADTTQSPLDHSLYVLMGRYVELDENDRILKGVYRDESLKQIVYRIEKTEVPGPNSGGGFGNILSMDMNWIEVEKPPANYNLLIEYIVY